MGCSEMSLITHKVMKNHRNRSSAVNQVLVLMRLHSYARPEHRLQFLALKAERAP